MLCFPTFIEDTKLFDVQDEVHTYIPSIGKNNM